MGAGCVWRSADRAVGRFISLDKRWNSKAAWEVAGVARNVRFADPRDPFGMLVLSAMLLGLVAALAGYLPARRASRLEPMHALRQE